MNKEGLYIGQRVCYIPTHAQGYRWHPDCEKGIVRSFNRDGHPFVVYDNKVRGEMLSLLDAERWTAALTDPADLVPLHSDCNGTNHELQPEHRHDDGTWWFYDETWSDEYGPYPDFYIASLACIMYCIMMLGINKDELT